MQHVGDGHDDVEVERLGGPRSDDLDRSGAAEEACHLVDRAHGGREADALSRLVEERVEAF
ncbi:MAG: hypothetical protein K0S49_2320, partial [Microbacterium sp.]|nr:hypothetical protein [Microbacterium sp.]